MNNETLSEQGEKIMKAVLDLPIEDHMRLFHELKKYTADRIAKAAEEYYNKANSLKEFIVTVLDNKQVKEGFK